jgi:hypothetical protein
MARLFMLLVVVSSCLHAHFAHCIGVPVGEQRPNRSRFGPRAAGASDTNTVSVAPAQDWGQLLLVKCTEQQGVVRIGPRLELVRVGDRLGTTQAVVKELAVGRMVLEETFLGEDGGWNRALIVLTEGARGGTRFLQRSEEPRLVGITPLRPQPTPSKKP